MGWRLLLMWRSTGFIFDELSRHSTYKLWTIRKLIGCRTGFILSQSCLRLVKKTTLQILWKIIATFCRWNFKLLKFLLKSNLDFIQEFFSVRHLRICRIVILVDQKHFLIHEIKLTNGQITLLILLDHSFLVTVRQKNRDFLSQLVQCFVLGSDKFCRFASLSQIFIHNLYVIF